MLAKRSAVNRPVDSFAARAVAAPLLDWYDRHRRDLPWRAAPEEAPDPYRVWLSEVMLQQTSVATVRPRFAHWVTRWPTFESLAAAAESDVMAAWAGLGYYARARNLLKAARVIADEHGGQLPDTEAALRRLPGFGDYTAAAVAAIAFGRRAVVVDANVERVVARLYAIATPLPAARKAIRAATDAITPDARAGDFAQALMDLGQAVCTARAPKCLLCPVQAQCDALAEGEPARFPVKAAKAPRPQRYGTIFWLQRGEAVLLVRRPARGLLGGMRALPSGEWGDAPPGLAGAPYAGEWRIAAAAVTHGFTHFTLELALATAMLPGELAIDPARAQEGAEWWPIADLAAAGLPTVFRKAAEQVRREQAWHDG